jgi:predicted GIY-YIG superfamily endonuclease
MNYVVYLLKSENLSYIGMTNNFERRWKQHMGILQGGAKYTRRSNEWSPLCIIDGFKTKQEAMQCEWKLKRVKGYHQRVIHASKLLQSEGRWTKKSPFIKEQTLSVYVIPKYQKYFKNPDELIWYNSIQE